MATGESRGMFVALAASLAVTQTPYVVKVGGSSPIQTIAEAVEAVRSGRQPGQPARIEVAPGTYAVLSTIRLGPEDSGLSIVGRGRSARLQGGVALNRWRTATDPAIVGRLAPAAKGKVLVADLAAAGVDPGRLVHRGFGVGANPEAMELFRLGRPMTLARYPNADAPNGGWLRTGEASEDGFVCNDPSVKGWRGWKDVWVYGYWVFDWAETHDQVAGFDAATGKVTTAPPRSGYGYKAGRRYYFENALEALDQPGEYWVDRESRRVYAIFEQTPKPGEVLASALPGPMFEVDGASDVRIEGFTLEVGRTSAVAVRSARRVVVADCLIRDFGGNGVQIQGEECGVERCELTDLGEGGVVLEGGDRAKLTPGKNFVRGSEIHRVSRWCRTYRPAVLVQGVGHTVAGNRFHDLPHTAILWGGNDHLFERNLVERVCTDTGDAGAFYAGRDATMRGTVVRWNWFRDVNPTVSTEGNYTSVMSVYLDDCLCGTTVYGNVFETKGIGVMIGGGRDNRVENNVFLGCQPAISFDARGKGWAKGLFQRGGEWGYMERMDAMKPLEPPYSTRYPQLARALRSGEDLAHPAGNAVLRNVCFGGSWIAYLDGLTDKDLELRDNVVEARALTLEEALKRVPPGFRRIPLERIGKP